MTTPTDMGKNMTNLFHAINVKMMNKTTNGRYIPLHVEMDDANVHGETPAKYQCSAAGLTLDVTVFYCDDKVWGNPQNKRLYLLMSRDGLPGQLIKKEWPSETEEEDFWIRQNRLRAERGALHLNGIMAECSEPYPIFSTAGTSTPIATMLARAGADDCGFPREIAGLMRAHYLDHCQAEYHGGLNRELQFYEVKGKGNVSIRVAFYPFQDRSGTKDIDIDVPGGLRQKLKEQSQRLWLSAEDWLEEVKCRFDIFDYDALRNVLRLNNAGMQLGPQRVNGLGLYPKVQDQMRQAHSNATKRLADLASDMATVNVDLGFSNLQEPVANFLFCGKHDMSQLIMEIKSTVEAGNVPEPERLVHFVAGLSKGDSIFWEVFTPDVEASDLELISAPRPDRVEMYFNEPYFLQLRRRDNPLTYYIISENVLTSTFINGLLNPGLTEWPAEMSSQMYQEAARELLWPFDYRWYAEEDECRSQRLDGSKLDHQPRIADAEEILKLKPDRSFFQYGNNHDLLIPERIEELKTYIMTMKRCMLPPSTINAGRPSSTSSVMGREDGQSVSSVRSTPNDVQQAIMSLMTGGAPSNALLYAPSHSWSSVDEQMVFTVELGKAYHHLPLRAADVSGMSFRPPRSSPPPTCPPSPTSSEPSDAMQRNKEKYPCILAQEVHFENSLNMWADRMNPQHPLAKHNLAAIDLSPQMSVLMRDGASEMRFLNETFALGRLLEDNDGWVTDAFRLNKRFIEWESASEGFPRLPLVTIERLRAALHEAFWKAQIMECQSHTYHFWMRMSLLQSNYVDTLLIAWKRPWGPDGPIEGSALQDSPDGPEFVLDALRRLREEATDLNAEEVSLDELHELFHRILDIACNQLEVDEANRVFPEHYGGSSRQECWLSHVYTTGYVSTEAERHAVTRRSATDQSSWKVRPFNSMLPHPIHKVVTSRNQHVRSKPPSFHQQLLLHQPANERLSSEQVQALAGEKFNVPFDQVQKVDRAFATELGLTGLQQYSSTEQTLVVQSVPTVETHSTLQTNELLSAPHGSNDPGASTSTPRRRSREGEGVGDRQRNQVSRGEESQSPAGSVAGENAATPSVPPSPPPPTPMLLHRKDDVKVYECKWETSSLITMVTLSNLASNCFGGFTAYCMGSASPEIGPTSPPPSPPRSEAGDPLGEELPADFQVQLRVLVSKVKTKQIAEADVTIFASMSVDELEAAIRDKFNMSRVQIDESAKLVMFASGLHLESGQTLRSHPTLLAGYDGRPKLKVNMTSELYMPPLGLREWPTGLLQVGQEDQEPPPQPSAGPSLAQVEPFHDQREPSVKLGLYECQLNGPDVLFDPRHGRRVYLAFPSDMLQRFADLGVGYYNRLEFFLQGVAREFGGTLLKINHIEEAPLDLEARYSNALFFSMSHGNNSGQQQRQLEVACSRLISWVNQYARDFRSYTTETDSVACFTPDEMRLVANAMNYMQVVRWTQYFERGDHVQLQKTISFPTAKGNRRFTKFGPFDDYSSGDGSWQPSQTANKHGIPAKHPSEFVIVSFNKVTLQYLIVEQGIDRNGEWEPMKVESSATWVLREDIKLSLDPRNWISPCSDGSVWDPDQKELRANQFRVNHAYPSALPPPPAPIPVPLWFALGDEPPPGSPPTSIPPSPAASENGDEDEQAVLDVPTTEDDGAPIIEEDDGAPIIEDGSDADSRASEILEQSTETAVPTTPTPAPPAPAPASSEPAGSSSQPFSAEETQRLFTLEQQEMQRLLTQQRQRADALRQARQPQQFSTLRQAQQPQQISGAQPGAVHSRVQLIEASAENTTAAENALVTPPQLSSAEDGSLFAGEPPRILELQSQPARPEQEDPGEPPVFNEDEDLSSEGEPTQPQGLELMTQEAQRQIHQLKKEQAEQQREEEVRAEKLLQLQYNLASLEEARSQRELGRLNSAEAGRRARSTLVVSDTQQKIAYFSAQPVVQRLGGRIAHGKIVVIMSPGLEVFGLNMAMANKMTMTNIFTRWISVLAVWGRSKYDRRSNCVLSATAVSEYVNSMARDTPGHRMALDLAEDLGRDDLLVPSISSVGQGTNSTAVARPRLLHAGRWEPIALAGARSSIGGEGEAGQPSMATPLLTTMTRPGKSDFRPPQAKSNVTPSHQVFGDSYPQPSSRPYAKVVSETERNEKKNSEKFQEAMDLVNAAESDPEMRSDPTVIRAIQGIRQHRSAKDYSDMLEHSLQHHDHQVEDLFDTHIVSLRAATQAITQAKAAEAVAAEKKADEQLIVEQLKLVERLARKEIQVASDTEMTLVNAWKSCHNFHQLLIALTGSHRGVLFAFQDTSSESTLLMKIPGLGVVPIFIRRWGAEMATVQLVEELAHDDYLQTLIDVYQRNPNRWKTASKETGADKRYLKEENVFAIDVDPETFKKELATVRNANPADAKRVLDLVKSPEDINGQTAYCRSIDNEEVRKGRYHRSFHQDTQEYIGFKNLQYGLKCPPFPKSAANTDRVVRAKAYLEYRPRIVHFVSHRLQHGILRQDLIIELNSGMIYGWGTDQPVPPGLREVLRRLTDMQTQDHPLLKFLPLTMDLMLYDLDAHYSNLTSDDSQERKEWTECTYRAAGEDQVNLVIKRVLATFLKYLNAVERISSGKKDMYKEATLLENGHFMQQFQEQLLMVLKNDLGSAARGEATMRKFRLESSKAKSQFDLVRHEGRESHDFMMYGQRCLPSYIAEHEMTHWEEQHEADWTLEIHNPAANPAKTIVPKTGGRQPHPPAQDQDTTPQTLPLPPQNATKKESTDWLSKMGDYRKRAEKADNRPMVAMIESLQTTHRQTMGLPAPKRFNPPNAGAQTSNQFAPPYQFQQEVFRSVAAPSGNMGHPLGEQWTEASWLGQVAKKSGEPQFKVDHRKLQTISTHSDRLRQLVAALIPADSNCNTIAPPDTVSAKIYDSPPIISKNGQPRFKWAAHACKYCLNRPKAPAGSPQANLNHKDNWMYGMGDGAHNLYTCLPMRRAVAEGCAPLVSMTPAPNEEEKKMIRDCLVEFNSF